MKRMTLGLIVSMMLLPAVSFAQTNSQPPASWVAFQKKENAKRQTFFKEMKIDRDAFLKSHPEAKAYLDQMREAAKARMAAWRTTHENKMSVPMTATGTH